MGIKMVRVREATCVRCKYSWLLRKPGRPVKCPGCSSPLWDRPRIYKKPGKKVGKKKRKGG